MLSAKRLRPQPMAPEKTRVPGAYGGLPRSELLARWMFGCSYCLPEVLGLLPLSYTGFTGGGEGEGRGKRGRGWTSLKPKTINKSNQCSAWLAGPVRKKKQQASGLSRLIALKSLCTS